MCLSPFPDTSSLLYDTGHGFAAQMSAAYSAMVRSLENFPAPATFKMALPVHAFGSPGFDAGTNHVLATVAEARDSAVGDGTQRVLGRQDEGVAIRADELTDESLD